MNTATEMRKMADGYHSEVIAKTLRDARNFCDNKVSVFVEKEAKCGGYSVTFGVPCGIDADAVADYLTENGYEVLFKPNKYITINW